VITAEEFAKVVDGTLIGVDPATQTTGQLFFDSRERAIGGVFLALAGEEHDGHDFAGQANAPFSLVSKRISSPSILVPDVLLAAAKYAEFHRNHLKNLQVVAITGSQGKTTTKDLIAHLIKNSSLQGADQIVAPPGSLNNELGVPVTLTRCTDQTRFAVLEMGARHKGDIAALTKIARPDIGVVLKVGTAHIGEFGSRKVIAETKQELIDHLPKNAIAILGNYDEFTPLMSGERSDLQRFIFGESGGENVRAADIQMRGGFSAFELVTPSGREVVELRIAGRHNVANALAAAAVGVALGMKENEIASGLSTFEPLSKWRMEISELADVTVLNDSYNANPESMAAALATLRLMAQANGGRAFAFLGKMNELGDDSDQFHREVAMQASTQGIDYLISINEPRYLLEGHQEWSCSDSFQSAAKYFPYIEPGDCVLFKASRSEGLERLASLFLDELRNRIESGDSE
jgi:UDP-N-acetylmuramoyl-tripeptide--D-alanyl-D-alanine ligase